MLSFVALEGVLQDYLGFCSRPQQKTCETGTVDSFFPSRHRCYPALIIFPVLILTFLSLRLLHIYDIEMPKTLERPFKLNLFIHAIQIIFMHLGIKRVCSTKSREDIPSIQCSMSMNTNVLTWLTLIYVRTCLIVSSVYSLTFFLLDI